MEGTRNFFEPKVTIQLTPAELEAVIASRVRAALAENASVFPNGDLLRQAEEARRQTDDALSRAICSNILGATSFEPKDNKRKGPESMGRISDPRPEKKATVSHPNSSDKKRSGHSSPQPHCPRCEQPHSGYCTVVCNKCGRQGHIRKNCTRPTPAPIAAVKSSNGPVSSNACFKCNGIGHIRRRCPELGNSKDKAPRLVYALNTAKAKDNLALCTRCEKYHPGYCYVKCTRCGRQGHIVKNCRNPKTTSNTSPKLSTDPSPSKACFICGEVGHIKRHCPKIMKVKKEVPEPSSCAYCGGSQG